MEEPILVELERQGGLVEERVQDAGPNVSLSVAADDHDDDHEVMWVVIESTLLLCILCGNALTISAVIWSRRLARATSSQFVLSLAVADFLVGFFLPFHISFYISGGNLGSQKTACLLKFSLMVFAFTCSLYSLICISVDRYIYILYPLHYTTYVTKRVAWTAISVGWAYSMCIAVMPFVWNSWETAAACELHEVLPLHFTLFVLSPNFGLIWSAMALVYWRIWREATSVRRRWGTAPGKPSDGKSIQVVFLVLGSFTMCWFPFFVVVVFRGAGLLHVPYYSTLYKAVLALGMLNSAMNPIIYAWKNVEFLHAFSQILRCRSPSAEPHTDSGSHHNHSHHAPSHHPPSNHPPSHHAHVPPPL